MIGGFKAKLAEETTPITEILDDETQQVSDIDVEVCALGYLEAYDHIQVL